MSLNKHIFQVEHPVAGSRIVSPVIDDFPISWQEVTDEFFFEESVENLIFSKEDFEWFFDILNSPENCQPITLTVQAEYEGDNGNGFRREYYS